MSKLKKSAHTLGTDELLEMLEENNVLQDAPIVYKNDVLTFISAFGIEPGREKIKQHTLFTIYKAWSQNPMKKQEFLKEMRNFLPSCQVSAARAFSINHSAIKLTHEAYKHYTNENIRLKSKHWAIHYENFLKFHALTPGKYWIYADMLYFIYDKYTHATGLDKTGVHHMTSNTFSVYSKIYLKHKKTKNGIKYAVSDNIQGFFQIGQLERMNKAHEKEDKTQSNKAPGSSRKRKSKDQV